MGYLTGPDVISMRRPNVYEAIARVGYVPNYAKAFAGRPDVYSAWRGLNGAIKSNMPPRTYELATLAAATRLRSSYCALAHGEILANDIMGVPAVEAIMRDPMGGDVPDLDREIMALADRVAQAPSEISEADLQPLRELGLADADIFDVILAAAARCFFSSVLEASGTEPDAEFSSLDPALRKALTVGRQIAKP
ncbi:MAG: carboxymuconolactone decarboxylase family protein [Cryobacterium sp.]|nr:carboxymuconolactone decarboxylase family protein [Cryobacterium sp.]